MKILITGGAGFIGINTAAYFLKKGNEISIYDNLSRKGSRINLAWIKKQYPKVRCIEGDVKDFAKLRKEVEGKDVIFHFAGQVAVTTSVENPREDFEANTLGTFNVLEAVRLSRSKPIVIDSSTNKVYGGLENIEVIEKKTRYEFKNLKNGVAEDMNLNFHSPYGCSKGAADQYVRDYARIYGLKTVVFRQSCIYGPHQFGVEDQGWVAWFLIAVHLNKPIVIYGNGKQVRDLLYIDDLLKAFDLAIKHIDKTTGQIYNIGGGPDNSISIWLEFKPLLEKLTGKKIKETFSSLRPGDQPIYVSNIEKAKRDFGWKPQVGIEKGIKKLYMWVNKNIK